MKKITSLLLVLTLLLCITACSGEEPVATTQPTADKNFLVGFGRTDVTPKESVPLASYGDNRMSTGFVYPALSNAVAITDADGNTLILLVTDLSWGYLETTVVQKVSQLTGVPEENIIHCGTHSHSGVEVSQTGYPSVQRYNIRYVNGIAEAAAEIGNTDGVYLHADENGDRHIEGGAVIGPGGDNKSVSQPKGDGVVQTDQPVLLAKAHGNGDKGFGNRIHAVLEILVKRGVIALGKNRISPRHDHAVSAELAGLQRFKKLLNLEGRDPRLFGCTIFHDMFSF